MKKILNHIYQRTSAALTKIGNVALCGHIKKLPRGFIKSNATCTRCVELAFGDKLNKMKPIKK